MASETGTAKTKKTLTYDKVLFRKEDFRVIGEGGRAIGFLGVAGHIYMLADPDMRRGGFLGEGSGKARQRR